MTARLGETCPAANGRPSSEATWTPGAQVFHSSASSAPGAGDQGKGGGEQGQERKRWDIRASSPTIGDGSFTFKAGDVPVDRTPITAVSFW